jgi:hypothetical protein
MGALTTSTLLVCATLAALFSRLPTFQRAYANHVQRMEDDEWLHGQCSDAEFFSRLRQHTGVCDQVRDTFNRPATLVALQACLPEIPWWGDWRAAAVALLFFLLGPSLMLPWYRRRCDQEQVRQMSCMFPHEAAFYGGYRPLGIKP